MSFQEIADVRRITSAKPQLETLEWEVDPDAYQRLRISEDPDLEALLRLLGRRGLDPVLVTALFAVLPKRPVERALVAYDVLRGSLLGTDDDALAAQLAKELAPIKPFANELAAVPHARIAALIDTVRPTDDLAAAAARKDFAAWPSLAGLLAGVDPGTDEVTREALFAHVRLLAKAHLPSLAMAFLQIAFDRFALPLALEMLVEHALDHDLLASVPPIAGQDAGSMQIQTYLLVRASLAQYDVSGAAKVLAALELHPGVANASNPSLLLVEAHLAIMQGKRLDSSGEDQVAEIASAAAGWRYARAVADAVAMPADPEGIPRRLDGYITSFGNDVHVWAQAAMHDDAKPALVTLLSRELRYGSHEPQVWRALSVLSEEDAIDTEVNDRTSAQLIAALA